MKITATSILLGISLFGFTNASVLPVKRDDIPTDIDVLNYALYLEHLEYRYYADGLKNYTVADFEAAGYPSWVRSRLEQIRDHEKEHVDFLTAALGDKAAKECNYKFPVHDVNTFIALSNTLENVGVSAYAGAAQFIKTPPYLTAAATVLSVEARHAAWVGSSVRKGSAWNGAFDTPLSLDQVWSIATSLISSCPQGNPTLPVHAFSPLHAAIASSAKKISLTFAAPNEDKQLFVAFITGNQVIPAPLTHRGDHWDARIPDGLKGYVYAIVVDDEHSTSSQNTIAGPTILEFGFNSANMML